MKSLIVISLFTFFLNASAGNLHISIEVVENTNSKSSSTGDNLIEYNNYLLFDVISKIVGIPVEYFSFEGSVSNPYVNIKVTSDQKISKNELTTVFIQELKKTLQIDLTIIESNKNVKVLYSLKQNKLSNCTDDTLGSNISKINRTLNAKCISFEQLVEIINDWYSVQLFNGVQDNKRYNFVIHHANNFAELVEELEYYYSISIKEELKKVKMVLLKS